MPKACHRTDTTSDGRQKLIEAFWNLLESNSLRAITVGKVAKAAHVNRGTFYYHYSDFNSFLTDVIERELMSDNPFSSFMFDLVSGNQIAPVLDAANDIRTRRLCLAMDRGNRSLVEEKVENAVIGIWRTVLHPEGGAMTPQTVLAIEYSVSGMMGMLAHTLRLNTGKDALALRPLSTGLSIPFLRDLSEVMIRQISASEGLTREEILSRLRDLKSQMHPERL